jgi:hypothetical protein
MTAKRIDANQPTIVAGLRESGAFVQSLAAVGQGVPDLLVGFRGAWYLLEIKNPNVPPSKQQLTADERGWHLHASPCAPVHIVLTVDDAYRVIGALE